MQAYARTRIPTTVFTLPERLDALTAETTQRELSNLIGDHRQQLVLDAGPMAFITSKGVRTLSGIRHQLEAKGGTLTLVEVQTFVRQVLTACGLDAGLRSTVLPKSDVCG